MNSAAVIVEADPPLWSQPDTARLRTLVGAGAVVLGASWFLASGLAEVRQQLVFVSLSLFGAFLGLAGVAGWLIGGRRTVRARTRLLLGDAPAAASASGGPVADGFVAVPDARWFHRADCLLVKGRDLVVSARAAHEAVGRRACPACAPTPTVVPA